MKKILFLVIVLFCVSSAAFADDPQPNRDLDPLKKNADAPKPLKRDPFAVSTDDLDTSESLNRIAGHIDTGYSSPDQSYVSSKEAAGTGPFAREKEANADKKTGGY